MLAIVLASAIPFADTLFSRMGMDEQFTVRGVFTKEFFKKFIEHDSKEESEEKKNKEKKIYGIINMNEILKQYPYGQIMGIGIGAYARSDTAQIYGVIPQLRGTGEKTGSSESYQLAYTLAEFGWLGAGIILLMYVLILMFLRRTIRRETEPYWKGINKGFSGFTFLMLLSVFYRFAWYNDTLITFLYWLMYAAVFTRSCRERKPLDVAGESSYREDHGELALQRFRR